MEIGNGLWLLLRGLHWLRDYLGRRRLHYSSRRRGHHLLTTFVYLRFSRFSLLPSLPLFFLESFLLGSFSLLFFLHFLFFHASFLVGLITGDLICQLDLFCLLTLQLGSQHGKLICLVVVLLLLLGCCSLSIILFFRDWCRCLLVRRWLDQVALVLQTASLRAGHRRGNVLSALFLLCDSGLLFVGSLLSLGMQGVLA